MIIISAKFWDTYRERRSLLVVVRKRLVRARTVFVIETQQMMWLLQIPLLY